MTIDYCKLNQQMTTAAAAELDMILLLEQINTYPGSSYVTIDLEKCLFFPSLSIRCNRNAVVPWYLYGIASRTTPLPPHGYQNSQVLKSLL